MKITQETINGLTEKELLTLLSYIYKDSRIVMSVLYFGTNPTVYWEFPDEDENEEDYRISVHKLNTYISRYLHTNLVEELEFAGEYKYYENFNEFYKEDFDHCYHLQEFNEKEIIIKK